MTTKQELLIGLTTDNVQALVDNLANVNLTIEAVCEDREANFLKNITPEELASITIDGEVQEAALISLLETKQFVPPEPEPEFAPYASAQEKINVEARSYLASTDWYVTRFTETGTAVPAEITAAREDARVSIIE